MPNLLKSVGKAAKTVVKSAIRKDLPPSMRNILEKDGNIPIQSIEVKRKPILSVIKKLIDMVANEPFDKLFHLFMIITLENGKKFRFEKNQVLNLQSYSGSDDEDTESISAPVNKSITMNELFDKVINRIGIAAFINYDAVSQNCQANIFNTLSASGLMNDSLKSFIKQKTDKLLPPIIETFARGATDLAAAADSVLQGNGSNGIIGFDGCFIKI